MITLTKDQQAAYDAIVSFLLNPMEEVFILEGYSGTGKSTLVSYILENLPSLYQAIKLLDPSSKEKPVYITATTNKACESLYQLLGNTHYSDVTTIFSLLELMVSTNYQTGKTTLVPRSNKIVEDSIIFIDEVSYADKELLTHLFERTHNCKIVLMGDPAQLLGVGSSFPPAFKIDAPKATLTQVMRQAEGNPIIDLATLCRETVNSGNWFQFTPDGSVIKHVNRDEFERLVIDEFTNPKWHCNDSKILAWRNKTVIQYNKAIKELLKGDSKFQVGDYAINNSFTTSNRYSIKTDQTVYISGVTEMERHDVLGAVYELDNRAEFFMPYSKEDKTRRLKEAQARKEFNVLKEIMDTWIDLREAFAITVNKSQGATYNKVFIDLDDIACCRNGNQIARMLYVGVSRAREQVIITGEL